MPPKPGNQNARKHGAYSKKVQLRTPPKTTKTPTIDDQIQRLDAVQQGLTEYIDDLQKTDQDNTDTILKAFALVAQNASRMVRMLQAKQLLERPNNLEWLDKALDLVKGEVHNAMIEHHGEGRVHA